MTTRLPELLLFAAIVLLLGATSIASWLVQQLDKRFAHCRPDPHGWTYVWHPHTFGHWRWLASHSLRADGTESRQLIPWAELRDDDIQMRVYRPGEHLP